MYTQNQLLSQPQKMKFLVALIFGLWTAQSLVLNNLLDPGSLHKRPIIPGSLLTFSLRVVSPSLPPHTLNPTPERSIVQTEGAGSQLKGHHGTGHLPGSS